MPTALFVLMNVVLVVAAVLAAQVGWRRPAVSLIIPSATLVNAIAFPIVPTIVERRVAPGLYTASVVYVPFSAWALLGALRDGVSRKAAATVVIGGASLAIGLVVAARLLSGTYQSVGRMRSYEMPVW
jgi:hypothetical protein